MAKLSLKIVLPIVFVFVGIVCFILCRFVLLIYHLAQLFADPRPRRHSNRNPNTTMPGAATDVDRGSSAGDTWEPRASSELPIFVYSGVADREKLGCAVCLAEFKDGEECRLLPRCLHCFHVQCIDIWLDSHLTCPLCRANVVDSEALDSPV